MESPNSDGSTLQPKLSWLADTYRVRLQQEDRDKPATITADKSDNFALCSKDHIESYAEHRILKSLSEQGSKLRRPPSAQGPRQLGYVRRSQETVEWQGWAWETSSAAGEEGEGAEEDYPQGLSHHDQENSDKGHALWLAAKRKHASPSSQTSSGRGSRSSFARPSSATSLHGKKSSLHPRPASAMTLNPGDSSLPCRPSTAMALHYSDSSSPWPSSAMAEHPANENTLSPRPPSAVSVHLDDVPLPSRPYSALGEHPYGNSRQFPRSSSALGVHPTTTNNNITTTRPPPPRSSSALGIHQTTTTTTNNITTKPPYRTRPASAIYTRRELTQKVSRMKNQTRPSSASASTANPHPDSREDPYTVREKRLQALYQAWTQDPRSGLHIGGGVSGEGAGEAVGPPPHLMGRHTRCLNHQSLAPPPHHHQSLAPPPHHYHDLPERPHTSCGVMRAGGEEGGGGGEFGDGEGMEEGGGGGRRGQSPRTVTG
ncbi:hypothetical protein ACOMHN_038360 [Nucella lapillus]